MSKYASTQHNISTPLCFLIEGINDFQLFSQLISEKTNSNAKIIKISNELIFFSLNAEFDYFSKHIKPELIVYHYNIYSIYLKSSYSNTVLGKFKNINKNLIYLYYEENILNSNDFFQNKPKKSDLLPLIQRNFYMDLIISQIYLIFILKLLQKEQNGQFL